MKVCFLNHNLNKNTGAGRFGLELIGRLKNAFPDFDPVVLTTVHSAHEWEMPLLHSHAVNLLFALPRIRAVFKTCDLIHALDGFPYGVIAALASLGLGKKLIITAIGTGAVQAFRSPMKGMLLRWAYRRADNVVAISYYTKRELLMHIPNLDIAVVNHAVDADEFFTFSEEGLTEAEKLKIEKLKPYMLSVGGWKKRKGFEYSFPAFAKIASVFPELQYVVVGAKAPKLSLSGPLGITDRLHYFLRIRRPFLKALYRNAELFMLLPYDASGDIEGFGFVFLEAAASGLSVVGTRESGAEDAIEDGKNGFLVEPQNAKAAADAAIKILSDCSLREKFSVASIDFARKMNWDRVVHGYATIYREYEKILEK